MIASGLGLGLAPRSVLRASASRDEIAIVDATGFAMQLDIWLIHLRELGNLGRAIEALTARWPTASPATPPRSTGERVHADLGGLHRGAPASVFCRSRLE